MSVEIIQGDCRDVLKRLEPESVDAIVTDPPAGVSFMGREWDSNRGGRDAWIAWLAEIMTECHRVLKPGGHAVVWALPRTSHWTAMALEDAAFEIRDSLHHVFGSGFPKSLDASKAIDKLAGVERGIIGLRHDAKKRTAGGKHEGWRRPWQSDPESVQRHMSLSLPSTDAAKQWDGWGTALKPAHEVWWLARKPLIGTVASNVLEHGAGALNIGATRIHTVGSEGKPYTVKRLNPGASVNATGEWKQERTFEGETKAGRWPANFLLSHTPNCRLMGSAHVDSNGHYPASRGTGGLGTAGHNGQNDLAERKTAGEAVDVWECTEDCPVAEMDRQSGNRLPPGGPGRQAVYRSDGGAVDFGGTKQGPLYFDSGGASRFFPVFNYTPKAATSERTLQDGTRSDHPTVKPLSLMRWLVRLVTPPGGNLCDPFMGSGTTLVAAQLEGFDALGIEVDAHYCEIARQRINSARLPLFDEESVS